MSRFIPVVAAALLVATAVPTSAAALRGAPVAAQAKATDDLAAKVKAGLDAEPELKNNKITVTTDKGNVTLEGDVTSVIARAKAGEIAVKTEGVKKVSNKLKLVKSEAGS